MNYDNDTPLEVFERDARQAYDEASALLEEAFLKLERGEISFKAVSKELKDLTVSLNRTEKLLNLNN